MFNEFLLWIFQQILSDNPKNISADKLRNAFSKFCDNVENVVIAANSGLYSGNIEPSSSFPTESTSKVFLVTTPGTYKNFGNVVLPANYFGFIFKTGSTFSLSKIEIPTPDMTAVNSAIDKIDDFIKNFKVDVDEEFDSESENPIANKPITNLLKSFTDSMEKKIVDLSFITGVIANSGVISSSTSTKYNTIVVNTEFDGLVINCKFWETSDQTASSNYSTILGETTDGKFEIILTSYKLGTTQPIQKTEIKGLSKYKKIWINANNNYASSQYINIYYYNGIDKTDYVKKYIDDKTNSTSIIIDDSSETNLFVSSEGKKGYSLDGNTGAEVALSTANISNFIPIKQDNELTVNSDRVLVLYSSKSSTSVIEIIPALNSNPTQVVRKYIIKNSLCKYVRFVYMNAWTDIYAKVNVSSYYINAENVKYEGNSILKYFNESKLTYKAYIYELRKKIINSSIIGNNQVIAAIGNNIVKYGLDEVETSLYTINTVSDWRCVWTSKNGITYFSPMNSYASNTNAINYGLYRLENNSVVKVLQLSDRQCIWGIDEDSLGNIYAGVYDLGGEPNPSLFKSSDNGKTFSLLKKWDNLRHIHAVYVDKITDSIYVSLGDTYEASQNFKSTDGGITWTAIIDTLKRQMTAIVSTEDYRFFGTDHSPIGVIYRTSDDKNLEVSLNIGYYSNVFFLRKSDLTGWLYAGFKTDPSATGNSLSCSIWISKNNGDSWEQLKTFTVNVAGDGFWFASNFRDGNLIVSFRNGGNSLENWQSFGISELIQPVYDKNGIVGTILKTIL